MLTQLLFIISLFSSALSSYEQVCNHGDQSSLLAFSAAISTSASPPLNWSSLISCCHWEGVRCDASGRVTRLELPSRGLHGIISSSISNLTRLTHLNLSANYLHGTLGEVIGRLTNLKIIDLSLNSFHGFIPRETGNLLHLKELHLDDNKLHGPIPSSLMNCSNLEEIILRLNLLDGDISKLDFSRLVRLKRLDLAINRFTGTVPESAYSCKSLIAIRVSSNNLSGQISPRIMGLKSLSYVSLTQNFFTNITSTLKFLARCRNLTTLFLAQNFYGESLPVYRNFIGFDEFSKLQILILTDCKFGGPIPNWLSKLKRLRYLNLGGNQMTGRVPDWLGTIPNLVVLLLYNNSLDGEFPLKLCQLPAMISQNIDTKINFFHFELPIIIQNPIGNWQVLSRVSLRQYIDLSQNRISGNIPPEIGNLQNIQLLHLDNNNFSGHIPMGISNLKILEELSLDGNSLTGEIPASLKSLHFLSYFNVSYNDLEGPVPTGGQFDTFDGSSFKGNPRLCGEVLNRSCTKASTQNRTIIDGDDKSHDRMQDFVNGLFVGSAVGFSSVLAIVASYIWFNSCKQGRPSPRRGYIYS